MKSVKCSECGFVGWADAERCKKCGVVRLPNSVDNSSLATENHGAYQPSYGGYYDQEPKKGLAIASLVLGILNLCLTGIFFIPSIVGIVLAVVAQKRIKRDPDLYGGEGLATAGLVTNIIAAAMIIPLAIIMAIAIPNLLASRRAANEGATMATLRKLHAAEATYQATSGNGNYCTFDELAAANLVDPELAQGRFGYKFKIEVTNGYSTVRGTSESARFHVVGVPQTYGSSGNRSFYIDETGVIRGEDNRGREATELTPPVDTYGYSSRRRRDDSPAEY